MSDDLLAYMARRDREVLESLEAGPLHVGGVDWNSDLEYLKRRGLVHRLRGHPRCGQDENPPAWYYLTKEGKARLAELRVSHPTPGPVGR